MSCELSPSAAAFSTMLSAFIGSVLNGLFSGFWIAFFTGWISWLAFVRILAAGFYELHLTIKAGTHFPAVHDDEYQSIGMNALNGAGDQAVGEEEVRLTQPAADPAQAHIAAHYPTGAIAGFHKQRPAGGAPWGKQIDRSVTVFGWLGWAWSAIYTPISQSIWLSVNITSGKGPLLLVRALAIAVSALGLTFDYKQRYGASLGRKWGAWAFVAFNVWNAVACVLLGVEATVLLVLGAVNLDLHFTPIPIFIIYPIFCIFWAVVSWKYLPPIDGSRPRKNIFADVLMGAFAGVFVAGPSFVLWRSTAFDTLKAGSYDSGTDIGSLLSCESASFWAKFAAIMP
ncbi:hypothetical protein BDV95DRAFT_588266 [Massariosphaeria phaeospora]|uniref:Uncharacterized protein n=1 Tax=Massariosphaeria phaeospora TaxID=100035 RepID=A0A7C8HYB4_9PLEO|nr:hypothetical protein BDV95DRAFT_588266 [Massariosphaeria phaeospora]